MKKVHFLLMALVGGLLQSACGDDQDPKGADSFFSRLRSANYQEWSRAPGYESRRKTNAPHGEEVDIFVNDTLADALAGGEALSSWPKDSIVVKDVYEDGKQTHVAAMEKRSDGWYWAEWTANGNSLYSGKPELCIGCHESGADSIRAFGFPQEQKDTLFDRLQEADYKTWARAPGYETRRTTEAPHGDEVEIFVNETVEAALASSEPVTEWPLDSVIVKDVFQNGEQIQLAAMEKRSDGWYWAEWSTDGTELFAGKPSLCIDCHATGADHVRAFGFSAGQ